MLAPIRTLPIGIDPLSGEALDSWLEALAARYNACWSDLLDAVGLTQPPTPVSSWMAHPTPEEIASLTAATGADSAAMMAATLARYNATALRTDPTTRTLDKTFPWSPSTSSRFCPQCLAETGGRWQLAWRLGWSFACLRHHRILADTCSTCGQRQRRRPSTGMVVPVPGHCAGPLPHSVGRRPTRCGADLTQTDTLLLGVGHPATDAQQIIYDIIDAGVARFGVYAASPQPAEAALTDTRIVANRVLSFATTTTLTAVIPGDLLNSCPDIGDRARSYKPSPSAPSPTAAVAAAIAVTAALTALGSEDAHQGGDALRWLVTSARDHGVKVNTSTMRSPASPVLTAVQLTALAPSMVPSNQLRHRIADPLPRRAEPGTARVAKLTRSLPTMLWPAWSLRLTVPGPQQRQLRPALSATLMIVGTQLPIDEATDILGGVLVENSQVSRMLGLLSDCGNWDAVRQALTWMSDYLVENGSPIDYQRRRRLDYTDLLPDHAWARICRETGTIAINRTDAANKIRCFLFERLSGLPLDSSPTAIDDDSHFRTRTADFSRNLTPELARNLENYAREFLATHDIHDEPPFWRPPTNLLDGLPLPGGDPADIDIDKLHQLIRHEDRTFSEAAEMLSTTRETLRYLLEIHPAPLGPQADLRATSYLAAKAALPPDKLAELYLRQRRSTTDIAEQVGVNDRIITQLARDYGIPVRQPGRQLTTSVEREWLHEQYITLGRPLGTLAREAGMSWRTMAQWAQRHNIPLRHTHQARPIGIAEELETEPFAPA